MSQSHSRHEESTALTTDADLTAVVSELVERVESLEQTVDEQAEQIEEQAQQIEELEQTVEQTSNNASGAHARINSVEDELETVEEGDNPHSRTPETGLEQLARLPDELLEDESANVRRSVSLAETWRDHASKAPVGFVLSSGELARVLRETTDCRGHSQTASRVIDRLDQLGGDAVSVVERRGERRVAFDADLVGRLEELSESSTAANHEVVTEATV